MTRVQLAVIALITTTGYFLFGVQGLALLGLFVLVFIVLVPRYFTHSFEELPKHYGYLENPLHLTVSDFKYENFKADIVSMRNCPSSPNPDFYKFNKYDVQIPCREAFIAADLYLPLSSTSARPIVVICHGIGSCRDMSLWRYAMLLSSQLGYCVLDFDYLTFGSSGGRPRQRISPSDHVSDILAIVDYVPRLCESNPEFAGLMDSNNVILFGTSYGAGHVLTAAGKYLYKCHKSSYGSDGANGLDMAQIRARRSVRCLIALVPYIGAIPSEIVQKYKENGSETMGTHKDDNSEVKKRSISQLLFGVYGAVADQLGAVLGVGGPRYGRIYGSRDLGQLAINYYETFGGSEEEFKQSRIKKFRGDMRNAFLLRGLFDMISYNPSKFLDKIDLPVMFLYSDKDDLCPGYKIGYAMDQVQNKEQCEKVLLDCDHFGAGQWEFAEKLAPVYDKFIQKHVV